MAKLLSTDTTPKFHTHNPSIPLLMYEIHNLSQIIDNPFEDQQQTPVSIHYLPHQNPLLPSKQDMFCSNEKEKFLYVISLTFSMPDFNSTLFSLPPEPSNYTEISHAHISPHDDIDLTNKLFFLFVDSHGTKCQPVIPNR